MPFLPFLICHSYASKDPYGGMATISKLSKLGMADAIPATLVPPALYLQPWLQRNIAK